MILFVSTRDTHKGWLQRRLKCSMLYYIWQLSRREDPLPPLLSGKKARLKATTMFMLGNTIPAYDIL
jgi:hypothetical protein